MLEGPGPFLVERRPEMWFEQGMFYIKNHVNGRDIQTVYRPHLYISISKDAAKLCKQFLAEQEKLGLAAFERAKRNKHG